MREDYSQSENRRTRLNKESLTLSVENSNFKKT